MPFSTLPVSDHTLKSERMAPNDQQHGLQPAVHYNGQ